MKNGEIKNHEDCMRWFALLVAFLVLFGVFEIGVLFGEHDGKYIGEGIPQLTGGEQPKGTYLLNGEVIQENNFVLVPPSDRIQERDIRVYPDRIEIKLSGGSISSYEPTGSMVPVIGSGANGLRIQPQSADDIHIGDIITFRHGGDKIVHRVIEKGDDEQGTYFITKGDSVLTPDGKIRFNEIEYITIGIIY